MKTWSSTQGSITLSVGEAECYAAIKVVAEALGLRSLAADLGGKLVVRMWIDSSSCKSIASRSGLGKLRHIEVKFPWLQDATRGGRLLIKKINGMQNPADPLTKPRNAVEMQMQLVKVGAILVVK